MRAFRHDRTTLHITPQRTECCRLARLGHVRVGGLAVCLALGLSLWGNKFAWNVGQGSGGNFRLSAAAARVLPLFLALLAISGVYRLVRVEKWLTLISGVFIALAPWVFGATGGNMPWLWRMRSLSAYWCVLFRSQKKRSRR